MVAQEVYAGQFATTGRKKELGRSLSGGLLSEAGGRTYNNEKRKISTKVPNSFGLVTEALAYTTQLYSSNA